MKATRGQPIWAGRLGRGQPNLTKVRVLDAPEVELGHGDRQNEEYGRIQERKYSYHVAMY